VLRKIALVLTPLLLFVPSIHATAATGSSVDGLTATAGSGGFTVAGTAAFGGIDPVIVGEDPEGDGPVAPQAAATTGVDLVKAQISQPNPASNEILFQWVTAGLPPQTGVLPEVTIYRFSFSVGTPAHNYVLQAKFSNLASTGYLDDPTGPPTHIGGTFQLRGNCGPLNAQVNVQNCHSLAFLQGSFDPATKTVSVRLPIGNAAAPEVVPGATLSAYNYDATAVIAGYSAGVSNASTVDGLDWLAASDEGVTYAVAGKAVSLGIAPAGTDPANVAFTSAGTLAADGTFTGTVSKAGLAAGAYRLFARACFGSNCGYSSVPVTV
jgi:hypothetical protein